MVASSTNKQTKKKKQYIQGSASLPLAREQIHNKKIGIFCNEN